MKIGVYIKTFFSSKNDFSADEWILKYKLTALFIISFFLGIGIFLFGIYRISEGNLVAGYSQIFFSLFLFFGFQLLRYRKEYYQRYSIVFFLLFFIYINIVFFFVPENKLNILWLVISPVLIFFFLDRKGGLLTLVLLLLIMLYLVVTNYPYSVAEYITLFATITTSSLVLYSYERVKEVEKEHLLTYNEVLEKEVQKHTQTLKEKNFVLEQKQHELSALNIQLEERVERELHQRLEQEQMLLRQCRMASMGEMIDSIAHQWRQPLMNINAVLMNIDRVIDTQNDQGLYIENKVDEATSLTAHMSQTIEDFRGLFKLEKEQSSFKIDDVVKDVLALMHNNFDNVEVLYHGDPQVSITSYRGELTQVIIIILSNAVDILLLREIEDKKITIALCRQEAFMQLTIADNAGGIDENAVTKIFDPYFTTKEQSGGTGLGLYIAKIIIEHNMHGTLQISNGEEGAIFSLELRRDR
ncbi:MAG: hypothetical protein K0U47_06085 [Epsilonproteobacteria bacterium]|nr:hypothetical protein [Campylobacterota bacterium]